MVFDVALDGAVFSLLAILVNIILGIPLLRARMPIKLGDEWEKIYESHFKSNMSKFQFKTMKDTTGLFVRRRQVPGTEFIRQGNPFDCIYLFLKVPKCQVIQPYGGAEPMLESSV